MHFARSGERYTYRAERSKYYISSLNDRRCEYDEAYDEKGWLCIPGSGELRIYRAEDGTEPPDIPQESRTKVSKAALRSNSLLILFFILALIAYLSPLLFNIRGRLADRVFMSIIESNVITSYFVFFILLTIPDTISSMRLFLANKRGERLAEPGFPGVVPLCGYIISIFLSIYMGFSSFRSGPIPLPLPESSENKPYFIYNDIGIALEGELQNAKKHDYIKRSSSLFSENIKTYERVDTVDSASMLINGEGIRLYLTQNVFRLKYNSVRERLIEALIHSNRMWDNEITAEHIAAEGFDEVLRLSDWRLIAVKGSLVAEINYYCIAPDDYDPHLDDEIVLNALAAKWSVLER